MDVSFYQNLQTAFINIHRLSTMGCYDEVMFNKTIEDIKLAGATLATQNQTIETRILLYCIATLLEIINENNKEKLYDFAGTIHNIPEIAFTKRTFKSFRREIMAFRKKYGKKYFVAFDDMLKSKISPLKVGLFYLLSPVPLFILDSIVSLFMFSFVGYIFFDPENIPAWFDTLTYLPMLLYPVFPITGVIYGIVKNKEQHGKLCIILSSIGLLVSILIFTLLLYAGEVA